MIATTINELITAASIEWPVGDRVRVFSPITIGGWGRMQLSLRKIFIDECRSLVESMTDNSDERVVLMREYIDNARYMSFFENGVHADKIDPSDPTKTIEVISDQRLRDGNRKLTRMISSPDGIRVMFLESIRTAKEKGLDWKDDEITLDFVSSLMNDIKEIVPLHNWIVNASGQSIEVFHTGKVEIDESKKPKPGQSSKNDQ